MSDQPQINFQKKRDMGQVINTTFSFLKLVYKYLFKDLLIMAAPFFILSGLMTALNEINGFSSGIPRVEFFSGFVFLSLLFSTIGITITYCLVGNYVLQYKTNGKLDFNIKEIRNSVKKDFFKLFLIFFLYYLAGIIGTVLLFIPGIYILIAYSLAGIIFLLNKNMGISEVFSESRRLVKNNWWRTFGIAFVVGIIIYAFIMIFSLPNMIYTFTIAFHAGAVFSAQHRLPIIILNCFTSLSYCFAVPISIVAMAVYYYGLKEEKDEVSLLQKIDSLGKENDLSVNDKEN